MNPYNLLSDKYFAGLTTIAPSINSSSTYYDITDQVSGYVSPLFLTPGNPYDETELSGILLSVESVFKNPNLDKYDIEQQAFILKILNAFKDNTIINVGTYCNDIAIDIAKSGMTLQQQTPILISLAFARSTWNYWYLEINNPTSTWYTNGVFDPKSYVNYINLNSWCASVFCCSLSMANLAKTYGQLDPSRIIGVDFVSALSSALVTSLSIVTLNWNFNYDVIEMNIIGTSPHNPINLRWNPTAGGTYEYHDHGIHHNSYSSDKERGGVIRIFDVQHVD